MVELTHVDSLLTYFPTLAPRGDCPNSVRMVCTDPIEAEGKKVTNDGTLKTAISNAARVANMANLKKRRKGKKKSNSLAIIRAKKSVVAVAEPAPAPSMLFEDSSHDNLSPAEIDGQNDRTRRPDRWRMMINSRDTTIEAQQQQIESLVAEQNSGLKRLNIEHNDAMSAMEAKQNRELKKLKKNYNDRMSVMEAKVKVHE